MGRPDCQDDRVKLAVATGLGAGYFPFAPGTAGSIPGVVLHLLLYSLGGPWLALAGAGVVIVIGLWSAGAAEPHFGRKDPGPVVIDEIAGQMLALAFFAPCLASAAAGFVLFRVLDVIKPWPCRSLERLPGAWGIMTDDLVAGLYANLLLHGVQYVWPLPC